MPYKYGSTFSLRGVHVKKYMGEKKVVEREQLSSTNELEVGGWNDLEMREEISFEI